MELRASLRRLQSRSQASWLMASHLMSPGSACGQESRRLRSSQSHLLLAPCLWMSQGLPLQVSLSHRVDRRRL